MPLNEVEQVICFSLLQTRLYLTVFIVMLNQAKLQIIAKFGQNDAQVESQWL
ncbi:hypothetical protein OkiPb00212_37310 [Escherichia coli]